MTPPTRLGGWSHSPRLLFIFVIPTYLGIPRPFEGCLAWAEPDHAAIESVSTVQTGPFPVHESTVNDFLNGRGTGKRDKVTD